jgi:AcrR family transcriptional regulator
MLDDKDGAASQKADDRRLRDPRRIRTREAIVRAGFKLFAAHQPEGVSMDELVRAAGISKQSFYNHFTDKDDLARHILQITRADIDAAVKEANEGVTDAARRIATGICIYVRRALDQPERAWVIARLSSQAFATEWEINQALADDVRAGLAAGRLACFSPETGIAYVLGVALALMLQVLADRTEEKALTLTPQFLTLLLRAFGLAPLEAERIAVQATEQAVRSKR